jgi:fructose/tagatose bisphosphate aldolase
VKNASVPLSLHIDHAQNVDHIREIIANLPVDSVMVDMSHYDEAENLKKTKVLSKECHAKGIAVEAESGRIEGGEDGIADTGDLEGILGFIALGEAKNVARTNVSQLSLPLHKTLTTSSLPKLISSLLQSVIYTVTTGPQAQHLTN